MNKKIILLFILGFILISGCTSQVKTGSVTQTVPTTTQVLLQKPNVPVNELTSSQKNNFLKYMLNARTTWYSNGEIWLDQTITHGSDASDILGTMCGFSKWYEEIYSNEISHETTVTSVIIEKPNPDKYDVYGNTIPQSPQYQVKLFIQNIRKANWCNLLSSPYQVQAIRDNFDFVWGI